MNDSSEECDNWGCFCCTVVLFVAFVAFVFAVIFRTLTYYEP